MQLVISFLLSLAWGPCHRTEHFFEDAGMLGRPRVLDPGWHHQHVRDLFGLAVHDVFVIGCW